MKKSLPSKTVRLTLVWSVACAGAIFGLSAPAMAGTASANSVADKAVIADAAESAPKNQKPEAKQPAITEEKKALILELLKVTDADKNVKEIADTIIVNQQKQYPILIQKVIQQDANLTDAQKTAILSRIDASNDRRFERLKEIFDEKVNLKDVLNQVALSVYDKYFTDAELKDIITFYQSPTGKKSLHVMPQIMKESMEQSGRLLLPQMETVLIQFLQEEHDRLVGPAKPS